MKFSLETD